ncbi:unnamed protein product [Withania somnifera]
MARGLKFFAVFIVLHFFSNSLFSFNSEAHVLNSTENQIMESSIDKFLEGLYVEAIKTGGPSSRGEGHRSIDALTVGGIKISGPSPGMNH